MTAPNTYICLMGATSYRMKPGETVTEPIPISIQATDNPEGGSWDVVYENGRGRVMMQAPGINADIAALYDQSGTQLPGFIAPFQGTDFYGKAAFRPRGPSMPGGLFVDVAIKCVDVVTGFGGGTRFPCRIWLPPDAPQAVPTHRWQFLINGVAKGTVNVNEAGGESVTITRDGVMIYPPQIFGGTGQWG